MKQFWLVRHGQSEGNIDKPQAYRGAPPLTEVGWEQARQFAASFNETPDLIVASTFIRAQQSAEPLQARYPQTPVEIWPIQEFTPLASKYYENARMSARKPTFLQFFADADPHTDNGPGSESFAEGVQRAAALLERLRAAPQQRIVLFSHATFMRIVYWAWLYTHIEQSISGMAAFGQLLHTHKIPNTAYIHGHVAPNAILLSNLQTMHLS